jgi:hypothetical protein
MVGVVKFVAIVQRLGRACFKIKEHMRGVCTIPLRNAEDCFKNQFQIGTTALYGTLVLYVSYDSTSELNRALPSSRTDHAETKKTSFTGNGVRSFRFRVSLSNLRAVTLASPRLVPCGTNRSSNSEACCVKDHRIPLRSFPLSSPCNKTRRRRRKKNSRNIRNEVA